MRVTGLHRCNNERTCAALCVAVPFLLVLCYLLLLSLSLARQDFLTMIALIIAYMVPPAGKETVIPLGIAVGLPWWLVALTMTFLDFAGGLFMAWNFTLALKIPVIGPWIERMMLEGREYFDARPWLERLYFAGLMLFVMVPFEGSGGISASILGRLMGMRKYEVLAFVTIGAFISCFSIALGADYVLALLARHHIGGASAVLLVFIAGGIALIAHHAFRRAKKA
ncbi:MAG TPA: hypothetical protein ENN85_00465 [Methanoculleus sp.]|nr:hypothetical protein [Methanoculleus sp.]